MRYNSKVIDSVQKNDKTKDVQDSGDGNAEKEAALNEKLARLATLQQDLANL